MTGTSYRIKGEGFHQVREVLHTLENPDLLPLLDALGMELESQTRRRISDEKTAPDGTPWDEWSERYAETRHQGQSLLQGEGNLLDSIQYEVVGGDAVEWGSNLIYAAIHQHGGTADMAPGPAAVPAREYLGLSRGNANDLDAIALDWAEELLH
ncbi:phage virion morphogenesis protein [Solemya pervernicosa gill symbiont]|uniref:Phage virion morphogenesis protein n=1 Tax=Solemya pervernicosa gill symbiont TaxID=642797 RepID=A0A1T2L982_9GAMM|nr:phage virion morphogenesis protein [Solemya pervernicosa gill symbiont]OOZ41665.1 phage virion morphogenesis protein [Solemya pervernicosa gill symbiont]